MATAQIHLNPGIPPTVADTASAAVPMCRISKEKLENMEWELRAWHEAFPALKYNKLTYRIVEQTNGKERESGKERSDGSGDRAPSAPL